MHTLKCWENRAKIDYNKNCGPITIMVPARFDFIGGWTDTPPYYFYNEGCVLNATLLLIGEGYYQNHDENTGKWIKISIHPAERFTVRENDVLLENINDHIIIKKTLEFLHIIEPTISLSISNMIPKGSGLGGSSLLVASLLAALRGYYKGSEYITIHLNELINNVLLIEQLMESGGGWQDQIGGILPGIKLIETFPENDCNYTLSYLDNSADLLNKNSLIIDTRIQRKAAKILYSIRQKYMDHDPRTVTMLRNIAVNARKGFSMLQEKKLDAFAELLSDSWRMVIEVECSTTVEPADILKKLCGKDLIGLKIGGAGGGGFILAIFQDEDKKAFYKQHIQKRLPDSLIYDPVFGVTGLSVYQNVHGQKPESQLYHIGKIKKV